MAVQAGCFAWRSNRTSARASPAVRTLLALAPALECVVAVQPLSVSRRMLLAQPVLGAAAAVTAPLAAAPAKAPPPATLQLFTDPDMNFQASFALGETAYGAGEAGEILATANRINAAGATYQSFYDEFTATAERLAKRAEDILNAGYHASARSASCEQPNTITRRCSLCLAPARRITRKTLFRLMQRNWNVATLLFDPVPNPSASPTNRSPSPVTSSPRPSAPVRARPSSS